MDNQSSTAAPVRSGIPRPTSRLPLPRSSGIPSQQLRPVSSSEQLRKKPSIPSLSKPPPTSASSRASLQRKPSRTSLVHSSTPSTSTSANTSSSRPSLASATRRAAPSIAQTRQPPSNVSYKKPLARPPSRQTSVKPPLTAAEKEAHEEDTLGDLDSFRSASRASSRAGHREHESEHNLDRNDEPVAPAPRKSRPSLSDRTIESLAQVPPSPGPSKGRRRSSFFAQDNSMPPPLRPASRSTSRPGSALANGRRPMTSDGTPQGTPITPRRLGGLPTRGSMTAPGKRSVSAAVNTDSTATPTKASPALRPVVQLKKQPLSQLHNAPTGSNLRPLSNSKTMTARTPKSRPSLAGAFGQAISPPAAAKSFSPTPSRKLAVANKTPETARKVSSSSVALREQIARAKAARRSDVSSEDPETPKKGAASSQALREQIAKAKEAARKAHATQQFRTSTPPREVPAVTVNEHGIEPDPAEIAEFDFGLDDPFNQNSKGSKSLLRKRIDGARVDGRLNIPAMGLTEIPDEVVNMYKYDPEDNSIAWGEIVDLTVIMAADNELANLPERMFPDVEAETVDPDDDSQQFGAVQSIDLHGNVLTQLPLGLRCLTRLSKLNLSRNKLTKDVFDVVTQIPNLRELKLAENSFECDIPSTLGRLTKLEVLELQGNNLTSLPVEIREMSSLRSINISNNKLNTVPSELFTAVPIVELVATKNAFSGFFFNVDTVPHLQKLELSNNSLSSLCETGTILLPALKHLDVSANRLSVLPDMSSWTSLITLLAGENKLSSFPEGFASLHQLRTADFTANDLTKLDERIALMESLDNLSIAANPLRERKFLSMNTENIKRDLLARIEPSVPDDTPDSLEGLDGDTNGGANAETSDWKLSPSGTLDLSFKNLTQVDEENLMSFAAGSNDIRQLYLQQNYLTSIPAAVTQLSLVTVLDLSKNSITEPITESLHFPKLRELRLMGNKIHSIQPLISFLSAPKLQHLDVSSNRISGPLPILREAFPDLLLLLAQDNAITEVSAEALDGLKTVNLSNNEIPRLEPRIGLLAGTLTSLEVEGNIFKVPNYAVLQKGTDAVVTWLRDKIPSPVEEFY